MSSLILAVIRCDRCKAYAGSMVVYAVDTCSPHDGFSRIGSSNVIHASPWR